MSRTFLRRQPKDLGYKHGEPGSNPGLSESRDYRTGHELVEQPISTGLLDPETNGVLHWPVLASLIEKIQELVHQGELTWKEVYLLFEKIFNTLEAKLKTTREEAIFGFRKSLSALREKIAKISSNLWREVFGKITGSKMFKQLIMKIFASIVVALLVVNPITVSSAYAKGGYYDNIYNVPAYVQEIDLSRYNYLFTDQPGVSNFSFENTGSVQAYDLEEGLENGEGEKFNLEQALDLLKTHPTILNNILFQIIDEINQHEINQQLLQERDNQPPITGLKIVKEDGSLIVELSGSTNFSKGVYKFHPQEGTFKLYAQIENHEYDIDHIGGVVVANTPYILGEEGVKQYTSGVFTLEGHCCGQTLKYAVFKELHNSGGGSVEIHAGGVYKFDIVAVGEFDAGESMDILSFDYQKIKEYFAKLLGLYDGTNPQWEQTLSSENSENLKELNQLMESFLAGELIFLRTCDGRNLYVGSNGQLHSTRRVVAVAKFKLRPGQEPPGFMKPTFVFPVEFVQGLGVTIRIENEDLKIIEKLIKNLYQKYPQIVEEALRAAIAEAGKFEGPQHSNSGPDTNSNSNSENSIDNTPTPQPPIGDSSPSAVDQTAPNLVDSGLSGQTKESQTEATFAQKIKYLNEELSKAGLDEILPPIEFVGETDVIDLQALVRRIKSSNKGLPSLITHFLMNRHHLGLLSDYIQVLDQLAVGAPDGGYKQNLDDFAFKLRLAELAVRGLLLAGTVAGIVFIIGILRFLYLKIRSLKSCNKFRLGKKRSAKQSN